MNPQDLFWLVREDGWIVDYGNGNFEDQGYTPIPNGVTWDDLACYTDLWYINGAIVRQPAPQD